MILNCLRVKNRVCCCPLWNSLLFGVLELFSVGGLWSDCRQHSQHGYCVLVSMVMESLSALVSNILIRLPKMG